MSPCVTGLLWGLVLALAVPGQESAVKKNVLAGRVRTPDRQGVTNASIVVRWRVAPELPGLVGWTLGGSQVDGVLRKTTQTDARGSWRLELPVAGPFEVVATNADGSQQAVRRFPVMAPGFVEQIVEPAYSLGGIVRDEQGNAMKNFELRFEPHPTTWTRLAVYGVPLARSRTVTDEQGRFSLLFPSAYTREPMWEPHLDVRPFDASRRFSSSMRLQPSNDYRDMDLHLQASPVQAGFVRDVKGKAIAGARVYVLQEPWRAVISKNDGSFRIPALRATEVAAAAHGYGAQRMTSIAADQRVGQDRVLELWSARRLRCRLVGDKGAPLVDHDVLWSFQFADEPPLERLTKSDHDGQVVLLDASLAMTTMGFVKVHGVWCRFLRTVATKNLKLHDVVIKVRAVSGMVTNADGTPVASARVVAIACADREQASPSPCLWVTYTDHGGRYRFPSLPHGRLDIMCDASIDGFGRARTTKDAITQNLQLPAGGVAGVRVIDTDGKPVVGARVMLTRAGGFRGTRQAPSPSPMQTSVVGFTGTAGKLKFRGLPEGRWQILGHVLRDGVLTTGSSKGVTGSTGLVVELK